MRFLYEDYDADSRMGRQKDPLPDYVADNLNPLFGLRKYQHEAFERFMHYLKIHPTGKIMPIHLLFNMATGSGKTLIMAGLILYLYAQGYRNFLFFVNTKNIIGKTRDNFLNSDSSKYLFNSNLNFDGRTVNIREVNNFEEADSDNINICFTTIQKLHIDMGTQKENSLTFDDFKNKKVVLLSDEAHHMQSATKQKALSTETERNWEETVETIFGENMENVLLEFTATVDYLEPGIVDKYYPKVIYCYDLKQFRNDGYSKDVNILQSDLDDEQRMLQAIIISQYRQNTAGEHRIKLKPVILFKAQKSIKESEKNQEKFEELIDDLSESDIEKIRDKSTVDLLQRALQFFAKNGGLGLLVQTLKENFATKYCLNVNKTEDLEFEKLNSLEDSDNQIRAIFAVQKLNEGWDVLNLFDIVRLYNTRDTRKNKPGKTTVAEAQLIGRGARYFPFAYENEERDMRKFDKRLDHPLRILEEMHYHSFNNVEYISELKAALVEQGIFDENATSVQLTLKEEFKKQKFYEEGVIYLNEKEKKTDAQSNSLEGLKRRQLEFEYDIATGFGEIVSIFVENKLQHSKKIGISSIDMFVEEIEPHIVRKALASHKEGFYNFDKLKRYFPKIESISDFMGSDYLGKLPMKFKGKKEDLDNLTNWHKFSALTRLLRQIAAEVKMNMTGYKGTKTFKPQKFKLNFFNKMIKVSGPPERVEGHKEFIRDKKWYVFNENYGTSEERALVEAIAPRMDEFSRKYTDVYLVRNERHVKIYNFEDGKGFEPDFLLFLRKGKEKLVGYQLFIEPKGTIFMHDDTWKQEFLQAIKKEHAPIHLADSSEFKIIGLPFYNTNAQMHAAFFRALDDAVGEKENSDTADSDKKAGVDSPSKSKSQ